MKIAIIGHSGGGKSTLAQYLATHYHIPLLHLDKLYFLPNWQPRAQQAFQEELAQFLSTQKSWVIDGVYSKHLFEERLAQADQIIFLNFSRWASFWRILKRYALYKNKGRSSAPSGCPETINANFLSFALFRSRKQKRQQMYQDICQTYQHKVIIISHQKALDQFYQNIKR